MLQGLYKGRCPHEDGEDDEDAALVFNHSSNHNMTALTTKRVSDCVSHVCWAEVGGAYEAFLTWMRDSYPVLSHAIDVQCVSIDPLNVTVVIL